MLDDQLRGGAGVADAVLCHAGEGAGVLGEDLLDDEGGLVVVGVVDLEVLRGLDDGRLPEPRDLRARVALLPCN